MATRENAPRLAFSADAPSADEDPRAPGKSSAVAFDHQGEQDGELPSTTAALLAEVRRLGQALEAARDEVRRLEALSLEDHLCGVLNRRGFDREFRRSLAHVARYGAPASLVLIDLDGFKAINDAKGHAADDAVLRAVANSLTRQLRTSDILARIGGDEFAIILWHAGPLEARAAADRLLSALPSPATAGIAALAGKDPDTIFEEADRNLYAGKSARQR